MDLLACKASLKRGVAIFALMSASSAWAQTRSFDVPSDLAVNSIPEFARQAGIQIVAPADRLQDVRTPAIKGNLDVHAALVVLLQGTGIQIASEDGQTIMLKAASKAVQAGKPLPQNPTQVAAAETTAASQSNDQASSLLMKPSSGAETEEIEVTATRVGREGYKSPTPMTVLNKADLQLGGTVSIGDALNYMPSQVNNFAPSTEGTNISGNAYYANLRGLGVTRTLTLIDGQRAVPTASPFNLAAFGFNLNLVPLSMVQRVETVTGGASAAWGSDAVAGVVNIILDTKFDGLRAGAQFGAPFDYGGGQTYQLDFALGGSFGTNDRGHYVIGGQYQDTQVIAPRSQSVPVQYGYITNPAFTPTNGQPQQLLVHNPFYSIASQGGLVIAGPLAGTAFGPGGAPYQFQYGQYRSSAQMAGGDPAAGTLFYPLPLTAPVIQKSILADVSYDVLDNLKLKAMFFYGNTDTSELGIQNYTFGTEVIQSGNPFIPPSVQARMSSLGVTALALGRYNADFGGININDSLTTMQGTIGAEGAFGSSWKWDLSYSYAHNQNNLVIGPELVNDLFVQALDVVTSPTTGKPVCRIALTNPSTACAPLNVFGYGSPSQASLAYFEAAGLTESAFSQNDIAGTIRGEPFSTWAGPVSVAAGGEYRRLAQVSLSDQYQNAGRLSLQNYQNLYGTYSVGEGFVEAVVPLLKDMPFAKEFDFNGAFRMSEYNISGEQKTWKLGFTDQVTSELMLRGTISQDIRAPNVAELLLPGTVDLANVTNPLTNVTNLATTHAGGNLNLKPELAHTVTYGGSYQPNWAPDLRVSVDWYLIDIHDEITSLSAQQIVNFCLQGQTNLCSLITPNPLTSPTAVITNVNSTIQNLAKSETSGIDIEASYRLDLSRIDSALPGELHSHLLVNYVDKQTTVTGISAVQNAGLVTGIPRWAGTLSEVYTLDRWKFDLRARYVGGMEYSNQVSNNYNHFTDETYFDLGVQYALTPDRQWVVYGNLKNVFDRQMPLGVNAPTVTGWYDAIGRSYNVGVRVNF